MNGKRRYEVGLEKLLSAAQEVGVMQNELIALQPALQQAANDVKEIMAKVESESEDVAKVCLVPVLVLIKNSLGLSVFQKLVGHKAFTCIDHRVWFLIS